MQEEKEEVARRGSKATAAGALVLAAAFAFAPTAHTGHDNTPPQTFVNDGPKARTADRTPTFEFSANEDNPRFLCKLDGGGFDPCSSPHTAEKLRLGRHGFYVKAIDPFSNVDSTAAARVFRVVKK